MALWSSTTAAPSWPAALRLTTYSKQQALAKYCGQTGTMHPPISLPQHTLLLQTGAFEQGRCPKNGSLLACTQYNSQHVLQAADHATLASKYNRAAIYLAHMGWLQCLLPASTLYSSTPTVGCICCIFFCVPLARSALTATGWQVAYSYADTGLSHWIETHGTYCRAVA